MLKKHAGKYQTQQKALELALESFEKDPPQTSPQTPEEELWMRLGREVKSACIIQKEALKELLKTADLERIRELAADQCSMKYVIEYYYQKPLEACSLKEVMEGIVVNGRMSNWFETISYTDDGDCYYLKITHNLGLNNSKIHELLHSSLLKTYGVKTESTISERSLFIKVYKNRAP